MQDNLSISQDPHLKHISKVGFCIQCSQISRLRYGHHLGGGWHYSVSHILILLQILDLSSAAGFLFPQNLSSFNLYLFFFSFLLPFHINPSLLYIFLLLLQGGHIFLQIERMLHICPNALLEPAMGDFFKTDLLLEAITFTLSWRTFPHSLFCLCVRPQLFSCV